ncbi:aminotransferase class III-fold pyridoxal phosphate-dependent enzyme [Streptomyces mobaraensis]|uniref:aspartate aminotransferase family protein n=1 Tax=Streptomyces mobaraensis TaxID=35621 RepID=UPI003330935B
MTDRSLRDRHRKVLPEWMTLYYQEPIEIVRGHGRRVTDAQGRSYLDFFAAARTHWLGYGVPEVEEAIREQLSRGEQATATSYLNRSEVELAERIAGVSGIPSAKVCFTSSGTEANELALMLTCHHRGSNHVLALRNGFHGRSFATAAVTGMRGWTATPLSPVQVTHIHGGYRYRSPLGHLGDDDYVRACTQDLREVLASSTAGDVACLIAEPVQCIGGNTAPPKGLFTAYQAVLREHGIPLVSDELYSGWGRTGDHFWGMAAHGASPDVITFAKGLDHGLSLAAVVARPELMESLGSQMRSTAGGRPLAAAAAHAVLDYLEAHDLQANAAKQGGLLLAGLRNATEGNALVGEVRGTGLLLGIELVEPGTNTPHPAGGTPRSGAGPGPRPSRGHRRNVRQHHPAGPADDPHQLRDRRGSEHSRRSPGSRAFTTLIRSASQQGTPKRSHLFSSRDTATAFIDHVPCRRTLINVKVVVVSLLARIAPADARHRWLILTAESPPPRGGRLAQPRGIGKLSGCSRG